jgi:hypothetical protein
MKRHRHSSRPFWLGEDRRQWDHVRVHVQVFMDPRMGAYEQAVYGGIACHAELQTGEARPSVETLAGYAKCDERTVRRVLRRLQDWGYIEIEYRRGRASIYRLLPPPTADCESGVVLSTADTESAAARTGDPRGADSQSAELERTLELETPLPPQAGDSEISKPSNRRSDGRNPRARGDNPRAVAERSKAEKGHIARIRHQARTQAFTDEAFPRCPHGRASVAECGDPDCVDRTDTTIKRYMELVS